MISRGRTRPTAGLRRSIRSAAAFLSLALLSAGCSSRPAAIPVTPAAPPPEKEKAPPPAATPAPPGPAKALAPAQLTAAKLSAEGNVVVLTLTGTLPLAPTVFTREDGRRVVLDFPDTVLAPGLEPPRFPEGSPSTVSSVEARTVSELGSAHVQIEVESDVPVDAKLPPKGEAPPLTVVLSLVPRPSAKPPAVAAVPPASATAGTPPAAVAPPPPLRILAPSVSAPPAPSAAAAPRTKPTPPAPPPPPVASAAAAPAPRATAPARPARVADCVSPDWKGKEPVFIVHFSSYQDRATAEKDAVRVGKALGKPTRAVSVDLGARGTWYRVVAGDFATWDEAAAWRAELAAKGTPNLGLLYRLTGR